MFLDCLLDEHLLPVYNDLPDYTRAYIIKNQPFPSDYQVYVGQTDKLMKIEDYLAKED